VVLVANRGPTINDITSSELSPLLQEAAGCDSLLKSVFKVCTEMDWGSVLLDPLQIACILTKMLLFYEMQGSPSLLHAQSGMLWE
jgi:hypothetical protein